MFEIEKGIEMPKRQRGGKGKYPFDSMGVGESFFVPGEGAKTQRKILSAAGHHKGMKFSVRNVDGGVRCWRIE